MNRILILFVVVALVCGSGSFITNSILENRRIRLQNEKKSLQLKTLEAETAKAQAEQKAKEADARKEENAKKRAEADRQKASDNLAAKKIEKDNLIQRAKTAKAEADAKQKAKVAADAEAAKLAAQKAASEAKRKELEAKSGFEQLALKRAETERDKAIAEETTVLAKKKIADAALQKSENELKIAKENAAAERDAKLRLYHRAEGSRAEMKEIRRAERMLAAMEAAERGEFGMLAEQASAEQGQDSAELTPVEQEQMDGEDAEKENPKLNLVEEVVEVDPLDKEIEAGIVELSRNISEAQQKVKQSYQRTLETLIKKAQKAGNAHDEKYYKRVLESLLKDKIVD